MNAEREQHKSDVRFRISGAFSLIEIMVTVALLSFIIIGLVAMFNQTRRAFTSSMTQVDILEAGRSAADVIAREVEQMAPSTVPLLVNFDLESPIVHNSTTYLLQSTVDSNERRTNNLQEMYFLTYGSDQLWRGIGYRLDVSDYTVGIGTLYRFSSDRTIGAVVTPNIILLTNQEAVFTNASITSMTRMIDGVVNFRVRVYDTNGNQFPQFGNPALTIVVRTNAPTDDQEMARFTAGAVPAYVEVEIGVLEDRALARYQSLTNSGTGPSSVAWNYLSNHLGQVHVFRQRIAIRNVNPAAY